MKSIAFAVVGLAVIPTLAIAGERTVALKVENMTCATCPITVRTAIRGVAGVLDVKVDLETKKAVVVFDDAVATPDQLAEASSNAGFPAKVAE